MIGFPGRVARRSVCRLAPLVTALSVSATAHAYFADEERWTPQTAYVLRPGEVQLGVFAADVGVAKGVQLGTDTLPWAAGLFLPAVAPNLHLELNPFPDAPTSIAVRGAAYYARIRASGDERTSGWILPVTLLGSLEVTRALGIHAEAQYTYANAGGNAQVDELAVQGGAVASNVQVALLALFRLNRVVALYARGRYQPWQRGAAIDGTTQIDAYTSAEIEGNLDPVYADQAWQALFGVALSWEHVNLQLGAGYGDAFLPAFGVVVPYRGVLPDANLFVRF